MPRYLFQTVASSREVDIEGVRLPDDQAARAMAVQYAGELLRDRPELARDGEICRVEVRTENGKVIFAFVGWTLTTTGERESYAPVRTMG